MSTILLWHLGYLFALCPVVDILFKAEYFRGTWSATPAGSGSRTGQVSRPTWSNTTGSIIMSAFHTVMFFVGMGGGGGFDAGNSLYPWFGFGISVFASVVHHLKEKSEYRAWNGIFFIRKFHIYETIWSLFFIKNARVDQDLLRILWDPWKTVLVKFWTGSAVPH